MTRSAIAQGAVLLVVLPPALLGCGAGGSDSRPPITTVEAPAQVGTAEFDDVEEDEDEDEEGESGGESKKKGKGKALGHAKKDDE